MKKNQICEISNDQIIMSNNKTQNLSNFYIILQI